MLSTKDKLRKTNERITDKYCNSYLINRTAQLCIKRSKSGVLFTVMFTKHSPDFHLICLNLACGLSRGILGLFQLIAHQAFRRLA